jgi:GNAT superfamily N-acetyltransferase
MSSCADEWKLVNLDVAMRGPAQEVIALQRLAYQSEAALIGDVMLPPLCETPEALMSSGETAIGCRISASLVGVISYEDDGTALRICRLMVLQPWRRKGMASLLLEQVLSRKTPREVVVETALLNYPGVRLYQKLGFQELAQRRTADGLELILFHKASGE